MGTPEKMTVSEIKGDSAWCQWFDREDELNERWFEFSTLTIVPQSEMIQ